LIQAPDRIPTIGLPYNDKREGKVYWELPIADFQLPIEMQKTADSALFNRQLAIGNP
jgi:hypothetical protein